MGHRISIDIAILLDAFSMKQMLEFYKIKYTSNDICFILRSLLYFEDAELQSNPIALSNITWQDVKTKIEKAVKEYIHIDAL